MRTSRGKTVARALSADARWRRAPPLLRFAFGRSLRPGITTSLISYDVELNFSCGKSLGRRARCLVSLPLKSHRQSSTRLATRTAALTAPRHDHARGMSRRLTRSRAGRRRTFRPPQSCASPQCSDGKLATGPCVRAWSRAGTPSETPSQSRRSRPERGSVGWCSRCDGRRASSRSCGAASRSAWGRADRL